MKTPEQETPQQQAPKKTYQQPRLLIYGTVRDLTKTAGTQGPFDTGNMTTRTL